ncbi:hypothetical protein YASMINEVIRUS_79 [Yasminevirus sp. GU-2018]|uniref:Uncharacterized protein n=1 Tax=Yasminevirus sp. GU-2018 TaxID=2420051 RepID=A0A5K0U911_9VIRU|nr:hypothetical protein YASMINEVIRUS_79 [Yasminevirus sp. GU-2018]
MTEKSTGLIDIGVNLSSNKFKNPQSVVEKAKHTGLTHLILTGTSYQNSKRSIELCRSLSNVMPIYCTVGIHPHDSKTWRSNTYNELKKMIESNRDVVVAVGETGLDYDQNRMFSNVDEQQYAFRQQIRLALEVDLPLFLHDRVATNDFVKIMREEDKMNKLKKVVHCFTSGYSELVAYLDADCFIGVTGWINDVRRNHDLVDALTRVISDEAYRAKLLDRIMVETDAPFLSPIKNVRINEPANVVFVLGELANVLKISEIELKKVCYNNSLSMFGLKDSITSSEPITEHINVQKSNRDDKQTAKQVVCAKLVSREDLVGKYLNTGSDQNAQQSVPGPGTTTDITNFTNTTKRVVSYRDAVMKTK